MLALAADLLGVGLHRLVAVVAVGDQQLGVPGRRLHGGDRVSVFDAPDAVDGAVVVGDLSPGRAGGVGREGPPCALLGIGVEREDGGEVGSGGPGQAQAVLLGSGMGPLVRPDATGTVGLDPDSREEAPARQAASVRRRVVLRVGPDGGLAVAREHPLQLPRFDQLAGRRVGVAVTLRQVERDHVEGRALHQLGALGGVDHVVGGSDDVLEPSHHGRVVVERAKGLDVGHGGGGG